jgi:hypothetical protein
MELENTAGFLKNGFSASARGEKGPKRGKFRGGKAGFALQMRRFWARGFHFSAGFPGKGDLYIIK